MSVRQDSVHWDLTGSLILRDKLDDTDRMPPLKTLLAQSESKGRLSERLGMNEGDVRYRRLYQTMKVIIPGVGLSKVITC